MTPAILVPRRRDNGERDRLWSFCRAEWARLFPGWDFYEGHHEPHEGPFNRSAAVNRAAAAAGDWDVAIIIDSDVVPDPHAVTAAIAIAETGRPAIAFDHRKHLNIKGTKRIIEDGYRGSWEPFVKTDLTSSVSGAYAIDRALWEAVGGFDELFVGWGWEDVAFRIATETIAGVPPARVVGTLWHMWHVRTPENDNKAPTFLANQKRGDRYKAARWDKDAIRQLLAEAGEARGDLPCPAPWRHNIPCILHRTVPEALNPEAEMYWGQARRLHPDWVALTHRDPLDPEDWPETSDLWHLCRSGAQLAGLIRLEALWTHGGVYLDSDVELYRKLDPLTRLEAFAAWEDKKVTPDAVLGSRPHHPAFAEMIEKARTALLRGAGAWESGPGVTTSTLPGRGDVLLLPPGSFYPYHYKEKHRADEDHASEQPWAFGAHHWRHSWEGH